MLLSGVDVHGSGELGDSFKVGRAWLVRGAAPAQPAPRQNCEKAVG